MLLVTLALASSGFALIVTKSSPFEWLRDLAFKASELVGELFSCFFCMGTWFAMGLAALYPPNVLPPLGIGHGLIEWLVSSMAITALAGVFSGAVSFFVRQQNRT